MEDVNEIVAAVELVATEALSELTCTSSNHFGLTTS